MRFAWVVLVFLPFIATGQVKQNAANYFYYSPGVLRDLGFLGNVHELAAFFDLKKGDRIADIGGGDGTYSCILSLMFDSLHFTVEDINKKALNKKKLSKNVARYSKLRKAPQNCTFDCVTGTLTSTNLPDSSYNVLFLKSSFHEFGFAEEMIADMGKKLKREGKIIMMDAFSTSDKSVYCSDGHRGYTIKEACILMEHHDFHLTAMRSPAGAVPNYANTLIFERNGEKSKKFIRGLYGTSQLENQIKRLSLPVFANDSLNVKLFGDSIKMQLDPLQANYTCFESWLIGFGVVYFENKNFAAATNVFSLVKDVYPQSYQAHYWLGRSYFEQKKLNRAYTHYLKALALNNSHSDALAGVKECRKKMGIPEPAVSRK
ncbi:MAG TPA: tetratricopeptide repeat protein [Flavobacteriales bacterium]|nr:tetratricopeptide repeat protein [Flavobacteriales bacterium]